STLEDLLKFGNAVLNQTLLGPAFFKEMTAVSFVHDEGNPYGLGWVLYGNAPDFGEVIGHDGGQTGANTLLLINPTKKIVVAVLSNTSGTGDEAPLLGVNLLWKCNEILEG
ncbi:MAG: beta-lactamase family protein, partial [Bacteroidia bacterium]|nr:beta-lactamase family protein [Bacteroidia bacterium]